LSEPDAGFCVLGRVDPWGILMVSRNYFTRQAATLLKLAKSTNDPELIAALVEKAAELKNQSDETRPPPDQSPRAPDVAPEM